MHLMTLLLQIAVVLVAARAVGWLFRRMGQPQVVGEMAAGILLGPSLLGRLSPELSGLLFPPESLASLNAVSQIGLILFMFLIGLELDPKLLRGRGQATLVTSHASIAVPMALGGGLALYLYPRLSDAHVPFTAFALFMGAAMSVTAFPVLARILTERNLLRSKVGVITLASAAVGDVTAWGILAGVIALIRADGAQSLWLTLGGAVGFTVGLVFAARPALQRLETIYHNRGRITQTLLAGVLLLLLLSAWTTEWIGVHALFGAFLLGAVLPKDPGFVHDLSVKLEDVTVVLLLPLFFAMTGLKTEIGLVQGAEMWLDCGLIVAVAVVGKFGGSAVAARLTGMRWREAGALGALMNTRGLMELVILSIGLELGVLSPALFVMMVLMALVTTVMTTPLLEWIYPSRLIRQESMVEPTAERRFSVLLPVALPSSGPDLLRVALALGPPLRTDLYALNLIRASDGSLVGAAGSGSPGEGLGPVVEAGRARGIDVRPLAFVSRDAAADIVAVAHAKAVDLILMGWHKPVISRSVLGGTVNLVMQAARTDVAVYIARHYRPWTRLLVPYRGGPHDDAALRLAERMATGPGAEVTVLHLVAPNRTESDPRLGVSDARGELPGPVRLKIVETTDPLEAVVAEAREGYDLVVIGVSEAWGLSPSPFGVRHERLAAEGSASLLIVRAHVPPDPVG